MINWSKYFDKIYCINFTEFKIRHELMEYELKRVGILDSPNFEWLYTFRGPFQNLFTDMILNDGPLKTTSSKTSCILGHLNAIKKAYYNGYNRILIIEDDVRFLKNLNKIEQILQKLPEDYDVILLDRYITNYPHANSILYNPNTNINQEFKDIQDKTVLSAGCYVLTRKGMQTIISMQDMGWFLGIDILINRPQVKTYIKRAIATTAVAVQVPFNDSATRMEQNNGKTLFQKAIEFQKGYKCCGVNFNDYMMRKDGSQFLYGDYLVE